MTDVLDLQVHALLSRMQAEQEQGCRKLREEATERSSRLVHEARHRARARIKEAVLEKRRRVREHCRRVQAEVDARQRDRRFRNLAEQLARGLELLPRTLAGRWSEESTRRAWWRGVLEEAAVALGTGAWRIEVAPGLTGDERDALAREAAHLAGEAVPVEDCRDLDAGLRIHRGGARYDATTDGLLADRLRIEAALLAELGREPAE